MAFNIHNRNLLSLEHHTTRELRYLLDLSRDLKRAKYTGTEQQHLKGNNIALIFEKTSTRTRCAFEVAAYDQGATVRRLKRRHTAVKRALLDQGVVSGIGNIYADEGLWRAQVNGLRECAALSKPTLARVLEECTAVMRSALGQGGTSFDALYVDVNGASGYFDRSLKAYGQEGRPCARCGTAIVRTSFMNRSSYFCPTCQPRPRQRRASR